MTTRLLSVPNRKALRIYVLLISFTMSSHLFANSFIGNSPATKQDIVATYTQQCKLQVSDSLFQLCQKCIIADVIESTLFNYSVHFHIQGLNDLPIMQDGRVYHKLSFDDSAHLNNIGEPTLPLISQLIALPINTYYDISISNEKIIDILFFITCHFPSPRTAIDV